MMNDNKIFQPTRRMYYGLDLLKFIMAIMVVAIHTRGFEWPAWLSISLSSFRDEAVPVFFIISSFLFFKKVTNNSETNNKIIGHFVCRLAMLYLFWFIVWFPMIIKEKELLKMSLGDGMESLIHDMLFSYTFHGSWFLSSLLLSVVIVYILHYFHLRWIILFILLLDLIFFYTNGIFPTNCYLWLKSVLRPELSLTFIYAYIWVCIGYFMSFPSIEKIYERFSLIYAVILYLLWYILSIDSIALLPVFFLIQVPLLFIIFHNLKLKEKFVYQVLRNSSILIFIIHFAVYGFLKRVFSTPLMQSGPFFFFVTFAVTFLISLGILWLKNKKYFGWLKYAI